MLASRILFRIAYFRGINGTSLLVSRATSGYERDAGTSASAPPSAVLLFHYYSFACQVTDLRMANLEIAITFSFGNH